jgi:SPP1 gp7 family putative phage head morphogenesis protein
MGYTVTQVTKGNNMQILTGKDLLDQQLAQVESSAPAKPIEPAKQIGISYNAELQRMIKAIRKDINELLTPQIKELVHSYTADSQRIQVNDGWYEVISRTLAAIRDKWTGDRFNNWASKLASNFVTSADVDNERKSRGELKKFGIDIFTGNETINEYLRAAAGDNARLIKTIPEQYLSQVESIVMTNMRAGTRPSAIVDLLVNQFGVTQRRAKVISRDQTAKINSDLARKRMQSAGIKHFKWLTSKDSRVRDRHTAIANKVTKFGKGIYSFEDLPLSDRGVPIAPGKDFSCRCVAQPILPSEIEENKRKGQTSPGVKN